MSEQPKKWPPPPSDKSLADQMAEGDETRWDKAQETADRLLREMQEGQQQETKPDEPSDKNSQ